MPLAFISAAVKGLYNLPLEVGYLADSGTFFGWVETFGSWVPLLFEGGLFALVGGGVRVRGVWVGCRRKGLGVVGWGVWGVGGLL